MRIYALATLQNGLDMVRNLIRSGVKVQGIVGLSKEAVNRIGNETLFAEEFCKQNGIEFHGVENYALKGEEQLFRRLKIDRLLVLGWQRLVPERLIAMVSTDVVGIHGSSEGITLGRGRSPQNWALILGKEEFYLSIFRIDASIDGGMIIDTKRIKLSLHDDILVSHYKIGRAAVDMISNYCRNSSPRYEKQTGPVFYYPKRTENDGFIDWHQGALDIYNLVRGLSEPYPGARTLSSGREVKIWRCRPYETDEDFSEFEYGEVIDLINGKPLVRCGGNAIVIDQYDDAEGSGIKTGDYLESVCFKKQMNQIIRRHKENNEGFSISTEIYKYMMT